MKCLVVTTLDRQVLLFLVPHIKLLQGMGYDVTIATAIADRERLVEELPDVTLQHISFSRYIQSKSNLRAFVKIRRLLKKENYDLVHVHTPIASFLTRLAAPQKQAITYTAHGFHFNENGSKISNQIYLFAEKLAAKKTTKLIVMNNHDYQKAKGFMTTYKLHYIHGIGIDSTYYNPEVYTHADQIRLKQALGIPEEKKVITHLAEFNENKRQIDIVCAAEKLKEINPNFIILLIGDGTLLEVIKNEIKEKGLTEHVRCLGFRRDIRGILSITDVGLLVSLREGLPKSVMEMMAMTIPTVLTNIRGNRELAKEGKNGMLIPIKNPDELSDKLLTLLENEDLRRKMGVNGRKEILETYDLTIILAEMKKIYESIPVRQPKDNFAHQESFKQVL